MSGPLQALKHVAALDAQIFELERQKKQIPHELGQLEKECVEARKRLAAKEQELKELRVKTELRERDLQAAEQAVIRLREQIQRATSNKEYQALQHEILSKEADNARLEEAVIAQMQKVDRQMEERAALVAEVKAAEGRLAVKRAELEKAAAGIDSQIEGLRTKRDAASRGVPSEIFAKYERLIARRGQTAMVAVVNGICQGCYMTLRPETIAQLRKANDLVFCHSCARILYLEEEQAGAPA